MVRDSVARLTGDPRSLRLRFILGVGWLAWIFVLALGFLLFGAGSDSVAQAASDGSDGPSTAILAAVPSTTSIFIPNVVGNGPIMQRTVNPGVYFGVWQPGTPYDLSKLSAFEAQIGKKAAIVQWYQGWGADNAGLNLMQIEAVRARGSMPMITWESWDYRRGDNQPDYALSRIAAGAYDDYIRSWAKGLAGYGRPVLLRWGHEMNLGRYPWAIGINGNTPEQYQAAWKRMHAIFVAEGATNVQWVWSPGLAWDTKTAFEASFPGDGFVDWVALDGYNNIAWGGWQSFDRLFRPSYERITAISSKPVMIAETGSAEEGGSKAAWIRDAFGAQIPNTFPRVKAVVWFNDQTDGVDWRVNSTETVRTAFKEVIGSPLYLADWR